MKILSLGTRSKQFGNHCSRSSPLPQLALMCSVNIYFFYTSYFLLLYKKIPHIFFLFCLSLSLHPVLINLSLLRCLLISILCIHLSGKSNDLIHNFPLLYFLTLGNSITLYFVAPLLYLPTHSLRIFLFLIPFSITDLLSFLLSTTMTDLFMSTSLKSAAFLLITYVFSISPLSVLLSNSTFISFSFSHNFSKGGVHLVAALSDLLISPDCLVLRFLFFF